jgi:HEAT repeat protein
LIRVISTLLLVAVLSCSTATSYRNDPVPGPVETRPDLIERLASKDERVEARKELEALGRDAWPVIEAAARHESPHVRWELANVAGALEESRATDLLLDFALGDEDPHVRWRSLWALSRVSTIEELDQILIDALDSEDEDRSWYAAVALSFFDSAANVDVLHENLSNPDPFRRWEAINALGRVHSGETVGYLLPVLKSPSVRDRQEAVLTLGLIGTDEARRAVVGSLDDPEAQVRWRAALVLGRGELTAEVLLALEYVVQRDPDAKVREQARASLSRLQAPGY